ncbi:thymidylate synthase [Frateuria sp. STR12]|uniref:thymidylate synthase n=1 Tax=Frateuria hangzhouensis TaxID=2995589 RepID=UPI00226088A2|nr:thymidylate synthase [Frateuria sp. STR12]MCX7513446.1 thymidylate synthase [Frateuria sp. STR12]
MNISCCSSSRVQIELCRAVMTQGVEVDPRGLLTRELLGVSFVVTDPRQRLTIIPGRRWSASLAIAELAWNLRGERSVEPLAFYAPKWRDFADEGQIRGSCYGATIFGQDVESSQWENVKALLRREPTTRRAVLSLRREKDVSAPTSDLSCTNTIQFIAREGALHAFVNMRSNDVIWGVPYDVFLFTTLQELMAVELGLRLGNYYHYAASMHIYERHFEMARKISRLDPLALVEEKMPPIQDAKSLLRLAEAERVWRRGGSWSEGEITDFEAYSLRLLARNPRLAA